MYTRSQLRARGRAENARPSTGRSAPPGQAQAHSPVLGHRLSRVLIQREGPDDPERAPAGLHGFPPQLNLPLGPFDLSAGTSSASLGVNRGPLGFNLGYEYGGPITAAMRYRGFSGSLGVDPSSGDLSLGASYDQFRLSAGLGNHRANASLSYGSPMAPMLSDVQGHMGEAWGGVRNMAGGLGNLFSDPMGYLDATRGDRSAIGRAISDMTSIGRQGRGASPFSASLSYNYGPWAADPSQMEHRLMLMGQLRY